MFGSRTVDKVEKMLDAAISGNFQESDYDETQMSRVECKWKQYFLRSSIAAQNLEEERENIKGLVSDISHQTKTPTANIRLYTELLQEELKKEIGERDFQAEIKLAAEISRQTETLEFLITSLTKMSRLEGGIVPVTPKVQWVSSLLEGIQEKLEPGAEKKELRLEVEMDADCKACFDLKWTSEALYNVLDNAVKYSIPGGRIRVKVKEYEMYCAVSVKDEGIGIKEEDTAKIFQRFYRAKEVQQEEGVGIGLYLAREIMRKQNGYIKVKSSPRKGSEFLLFFMKNKV